jgi:hypothetical protein
MFFYEEGATQDVKGEQMPVTSENGPSLIYKVMGPRGSMVGVDLTHLTHEELEAFRQFWAIAFAIAEPVVLLRDKEAQDAFSRGDDSFTRVHRAIPRLVVRARAERTYRQVLHVGLENVLARGWSFFRSIGGAGGDGDAVAAVEADHAEAQDDDAAVDQSQGVRIVDGDATGVQ